MTPLWGWPNIERLWRTPRWIISITNLGIYGSLYTIFAFVIGFWLAVLMDQKIRLEGVFRTIYLYPFALSFIVTGHVWAWIMNPAFGLEGTVRGLGWDKFLLRLADQPGNVDLRRRDCRPVARHRACDGAHAGGPARH